MTERGLAMHGALGHNPPMPKTDAYYNVLTSAAHHPEEYKVCAVCGNIAESTVSECPYCSAYRFEDDPELVTNTALDQVTHPRTAVMNPTLYMEE